MRHIHADLQSALELGLRDNMVVRVRIEDNRELIFGDVLERISPNYALAMHIDTDEANAVNISGDATGQISQPSHGR